jgi:hypothetical protein
MNLQFEWQKPIPLTHHTKIIDPNDNIDEIDDKAGIYYFARNHGSNSYPFYIGETLNLRSRLKQHLKTTKICDILRGLGVPGAPVISGGPRSFHYAYFRSKPGQKPKVCLRIAQRAMIREALANNIPIINSNLVIIKTHQIEFNGSQAYRGYFLDKEMSVISN